MNKTGLQLENIRLQLLDLGLRGNTMLHFAPRGSKYVSVVDEKSASVFDILVTQGKSMSFLARPSIYNEEGEILSDNQKSEGCEKLPPLEEYLAKTKGDDRFSDLDLQTSLSGEQLDVRLLKIENEAKTIFQEKGIDVLYLSLGFLQWFDDKNSSKKRFAPLVLLPVELIRKGAGKGFKLKYTGMELSSNETLYTKLENDYKIKLPLLNDFVDEKVDLTGYFESISLLLKEKSRWGILHDKIELGFFSFGKFQMYKDLDPEVWPKGKGLSDHSLLNALFDTGFEKDGELLDYESSSDLAKLLKEPDSLHFVKDADSSQTEAVLGVLKGANIVIQGPPGTGKSQTITNLIAEALMQNKKILFVAQKLTALEVVKNRLDQASLGDSVLELHSHKSRPSDVVNSIREAIYQAVPEVPDRSEERNRLKNSRQELDKYVLAVSTPISQTGVNYVQALGRFISHSKYMDGVDAQPLDYSHFSDLNKNEISKLDVDLKALVSHMESMGVPSPNVFADIGITEVSPIFQEKVKRILNLGLELLEKIKEKSSWLAQELQLNDVDNFSQMEMLALATQRSIDAPRLEGVMVNTGDWTERSQNIEQALNAGDKASSIRKDLERYFLPQAFSRESQSILIEIRGGLLGRTGKWWRFLSHPYRKAKTSLQNYSKEQLPKNSALYLKWTDNLLEVIEQEKILETYSSLLSVLFGVQWQEKNSDWNVLKELAVWVFQLYEQIGKGELPDSLKSLFHGGSDFSHLQKDLNVFREYLNRWDSWIRELSETLLLNPDAQILNKSLGLVCAKGFLDEWSASLNDLYATAHLNRLIKNFRDSGYDELANSAKMWRFKPEKFYHFVWYHFWAGAVDSCYARFDQLKHFDRVAHEGLIQEFKGLDFQSFSFAQEALVEKLYELLPNKYAPGEMEILRREMNKKRRLLPVRKLLSNAGNAIQKAKPVFMMSPMSVATFLPPGKIEFDIVIFDEASQVTVPDSIGAIARAKQAVVVGDSKQMPPTNFFSRSIEVDDEDLEENFTAEIESVLGLFLAQGAPEKMLQWHYRSRHDSLIFTSNNEFYGGRLKVFPGSGAFSDASGLEMIHLPDTYYEPGTSRRINKKEAKIVAEAVLKHIKESPHLTLGVVAFSMSQKEAVLMEVEILRRQNPELESFFSSSHLDEPFFVKNLENVQGDERDVIFISVGYGKTQQGRFSRNFGPINKPGGERRLNVLISRAKQSMKVFSNFTADDLKTDEKSPRGVCVLKAFLKYAQTREYVLPQETGREMDSPFEEAVYQSVLNLGYEVVPQVGSQGFFIDLAVRDPRKPGRYLLAIECDGASYHSSANARDRDRLRQAVLEGLGWKFHRIWSTDWFRNSSQEVKRIKERIDKEMAIPLDEYKPESMKKDLTISPEITRIELVSSKPEPKLYKVADLTCFSKWKYRYNDFSQIPSDSLLKAIKKIIQEESPVGIKIITLRLLALAGVSRTGSKIRKRIKELVYKCSCNENIQLKQGFFTVSDLDVKVRSRRELPAAERKLELISPQEIKKGILEVVKDAMSIELDECISEIANRLGFKRVTAQMTNDFKTHLYDLINSKKVDVVDDRLVLGEVFKAE